MTTRTTKDCDRCNAKDDPTIDSFTVITESYTDAAGSTSYHTIDFELCSKCKGAALRQLFKDIEMKSQATEQAISKVLNKHVRGT